MQEQYNFDEIELQQQAQWKANNTYAVHENSTKAKYYCLSMLPYPSGKLHMGHVRNYTIGDAIARFYRLQGLNVLQPFGWDAFGLPAENAALLTNTPPSQWTYNNIDYMRQQLQRLGISADWSREFATCSPLYYRHQQWLFIQLYNKGLIYRKNGVVNWDPVDQTVLANEQVIDGRGWRSGAVIIKKEVPMYYCKITTYAEELLQGLDSLSGWPEQVKTMQRNWIGKSVGMEIDFLSTDLAGPITVFTTRPDTLMGVTYVAISMQHPLVAHALKHKPNLQDYILANNVGSVAEQDRAKLEKTGVFSGLYVQHPISKQQIPVWLANYVLNSYGSGAVMGVPAHDQRDFEFAQKYNIDIIQVIVPENISIPADMNITADETTALTCAYTQYGRLINSGLMNGMNFNQAWQSVVQRLRTEHLGSERTYYRLHDWGISRQRYWGCPIPMIHCPKCGCIPVPMNDLPVILPEGVIPNGYVSPLTQMPDFYAAVCPKCGSDAKRETDTMDTFVDSSWYYLRYTSPDCATQIFDDRANYWTPVDQYIGGVEHAILHLLYARFLHKALRDLGCVKSDEPFTNLLTQGMVVAETFYRENDLGKKTWFNPSEVTILPHSVGSTNAIWNIDNQPVQYGGMEKMSKSKNNGIDPQLIIQQYGADTARLFMLFAAPPDISIEWSDAGIEGASRFMRRIWKLVYEHLHRAKVNKYQKGILLNQELQTLRMQLHQTIDKITYDIKVRRQFNTAIAAIMELLNSYTKITPSPELTSVAQELFECVVIMLSPITPHICCAMWSELSPSTQLFNQAWPEVDTDALVKNDIEMIIQINGKLRGKVTVNKDLTREQVESLALQHDNVQKTLSGVVIKKIIVVPNKIINIVTMS